MELRTLRYFVAVAEELHFGRAAARLHMAQPPLSRSIKDLEAELGCLLFTRSSAGTRLTSAGEALLAEARELLARTELIREKVQAGSRRLTLGSLSDSAAELSPGLIVRMRRIHPHVQVVLREADLTDPTAGLRAGLVDVAITRLPFDTTGIDVQVLRRDRLLAVLPADDTLAERDEIHLEELKERRWFQLPETADPLWRAYWAGLADPAAKREGPTVRTVAECLQSVLWDGTVGLIPQRPPGGPTLPGLPQGVALVPVVGMPESELVVAWESRNDDPLVRDFVQLCRHRRAADGSPG